MDKATKGLKQPSELTDFQKAKNNAKSPLIGAGDLAKTKLY